MDYAFRLIFPPVINASAMALVSTVPGVNKVKYMFLIIFFFFNKVFKIGGMKDLLPSSLQALDVKPSLHYGKSSNCKGIVWVDCKILAKM